MGSLRRAIIAAGQVCALVLILCFTLAGAAVGYSVSNGLSVLKIVSTYATVHPSDPGLWIGGFLGLTVSVFVTAILFALVEIAHNTFEHWFE